MAQEPPARNGAVSAAMPAGAVRPVVEMTTSGFLIAHEAVRGISSRLQWPSGVSGVTLGPGYKTEGARVVPSTPRRGGQDAAELLQSFSSSTERNQIMSACHPCSAARWTSVVRQAASRWPSGGAITLASNGPLPVTSSRPDQPS